MASPAQVGRSPAPATYHVVMKLFAIAYLAGVAWLLGWELAAFAVNHKYTISDLWWQVEGRGWTAGRYFTLAILLFLTGHLVFRLFR